MKIALLFLSSVLVYVMPLSYHVSRTRGRDNLGERRGGYQKERGERHKEHWERDRLQKEEEMKEYVYEKSIVFGMKV